MFKRTEEDEEATEDARDSLPGQEIGVDYEQQSCLFAVNVVKQSPKSLFQQIGGLSCFGACAAICGLCILAFLAITVFAIGFVGFLGLGLAHNSIPQLYDLATHRTVTCMIPNPSQCGEAPCINYF